MNATMRKSNPTATTTTSTTEPLLHGIYLVHISPKNVVAKNPGDTSALEPGAMTRILTYASPLNHMLWFQRSSMKDQMRKISKTVAERTPIGQRRTIVDEKDFSVQVYRPQSHPQLAVVLFADRSYPSKAAYSICIRTLFAFTQTFAAHEYDGMNQGKRPSTEKGKQAGEKWKWPLLEECLRECNDPEAVLQSIQGDVKTRKELEATTEIKHANLQTLLEGTPMQVDMLKDHEQDKKESSSAWTVDLLQDKISLSGSTLINGCRKWFTWVGK